MKINLYWTTRVLYEVFPMSFLMEQAGGQAFTGKQRVLYSFMNVSWNLELTNMNGEIVVNLLHDGICRHWTWFRRRYMNALQYSSVAMMMLRRSKHSTLLKTTRNDLYYSHPVLPCTYRFFNRWIEIFLFIFLYDELLM